MGGGCDNRCVWILCRPTAAERWDGGGSDGATVGLPVFPHKHKPFFFFFPLSPLSCVTWSAPLPRSLAPSLSLNQHLPLPPTTTTTTFPPLAGPRDPWRGVGVLRAGGGWRSFQAKNLSPLV